MPAHTQESRAREPVDRAERRRKAKRWLAPLEAVPRSVSLSAIGVLGALVGPSVVNAGAQGWGAIADADLAIDQTALTGGARWIGAAYGLGSIVAATRAGWFAFGGLAAANITSGVVASSATGQAWPAVVATAASGVAALTFNGTREPKRAKRKPTASRGAARRR